MRDLSAPPAYSQAVYDVAVICAGLRYGFPKRCRSRLHSGDCQGCKWYIGRYSQASEPQLDLIMIQAERHYDDMRYAASMGWRWLRNLLVVIVLIGAVVVGCSISYSKAEAETEQGRVISDDLIWEYLSIVDSYLAKDIDMNNDGIKGNCIDAALVFYSAWAYDRQLLKIMSNRKPGKMNHLFIGVYRNGRWDYIEPSASWCHWYFGMNDPRTTFYIKDIWFDEYDPSWNEDRTSVYRWYADYTMERRVYPLW